jgi:nucleoside-diphosphate-sugar epimerase
MPDESIGRSKLNILVTGSTGFLGFAIAKHLKRKKYDVHAMVRETSNTKHLINEGIPTVTGDVNDKQSLINAFKGRDAIIHCAGFVTDWGKKENFIKVNYYGTKNVLEACVEAGVRRLIHTSTVDIFGHKHGSRIKEDSPFGKRPGWYGKTKIMAEKLVREYIQENKLDISIIYPPWVYGEGDITFVPEIVEAIKDGSMMFFRSKGNHTIEISYIEHLTEAVELILNSKEAIGEGYIIADEPKMTFREFVNSIAKRIGGKEVNFTLPYPLAYFASLMMEGFYKLIGSKKRPLLTRHSMTLLGNDIVYDTTKLRELGFQPKYDFNTSMDKTFEYYHNEGIL